LRKVTVLSICLVCILAINAKAQCVEPYNDLEINENTILCPGTYQLNETLWDGIVKIRADNIVVQCNNTRLIGTFIPDRTGAGWAFYILGYNNVTIRDCIIENYDIGIFVRDGLHNKVINNTITASNAGLYIFNAVPPCIRTCHKRTITDQEMFHIINQRLYLHIVLDLPVFGGRQVT